MPKYRVYLSCTRTYYANVTVIADNEYDAGQLALDKADNLDWNGSNELNYDFDIAETEEQLADDELDVPLSQRGFGAIEATLAAAAR